MSEQGPARDGSAVRGARAADAMVQQAPRSALGAASSVPKVVTGIPGFDHA